MVKQFSNNQENTGNNKSGRSSQELPERWPMIVLPNNRDSTTVKDSKLVNAFVGQDSMGNPFIQKRPGLSLKTTVGSGTIGQGIVNWNGDVYSIFSGVFYKNGSPVAGITLDTSNAYSFSNSLGANPRLFMQNGAGFYTYNTAAGILTVSTSNINGTVVPGAAFVDGTIYLLTSNASVWGSGINDPTSWLAANVISAQIDSDQGVWIGKQNNYIVVMKSFSIEIFYDAANASGSPLSPVSGGKADLGCASAVSVQEMSGVIIWVGQTRTGEILVNAMEGLETHTISTPVISRLLKDSKLSWGTVSSWSLGISGQKFYCVSFSGLNLTLVYNLTTKLWCQWTDTNGNYLNLWSSATDINQQVIVQAAGAGKLYNFSESIFQDESIDIPVDIYTTRFDADVQYSKYLHRMGFLTDQTPGSFLKVRFTDDDYTSFSNFRIVDLNNKRPQLFNGGKFIRRAYHLQHKSNTSFRIYGIEIELQGGF